MEYFILDTETTGLYPYKGDRVFSVAIGYPDESIDILRIDNKCKDAEKNKKTLQALLSTNIPRVAHNAKFDYAMMKVSGFVDNPEAIWHDTMIMSQMLNNLTPSHGLDYLAALWADYPTDTDKVISNMAKELGTYDMIPDHLMRKYQKTDIERTQLLFEFFYPKLVVDKRLYADYLNELQLIKTTQREEETGITLDKVNAKKVMLHLEQEIDTLQYDVQKLLGSMHNLNSPAQIKHILFNVYKLPPISFNEDTGNATTDKDVLLEYREKYKLPILDLILKCRSYTKAIGSIKNYFKHASIEGIIHPNIQTNRAATGREACSNPNMQNVSKEVNMKNIYPVALRKCFRARPGFVLLFFDYAGIEMRLIIEATQEPAMLELLKNGGDPHNEAAAIFFEDAFLLETDKKIKKSLRSAAKNAHFALAYGAGTNQIAVTLNLPLDIVLPRVHKYKLKYPKIGSFSKDTANQVLSQGYVVTSFGRKLFIDRGKAYAACNYLIQGTAAGIIKRAQNQLAEMIDETYGWENLRVLLPIHDEVVIEMKRSLLPELSGIYLNIKEAMIKISDIIVPLDIEGKMATNTWFDAKELKV